MSSTGSGNQTSGGRRPAKAPAAPNTQGAAKATTTSNAQGTRRQLPARATSTPANASTAPRVRNGPAAEGGAESTSGPSIPFKESDVAHKEHHQTYRKLVNLVKNRKAEDKPRIFVFTDIEQDYDDLLAIIFLAEMHRMGAIELVGFVANHEPAYQRARFLRTILRLVGLEHLPVGVGSVGTDNLSQHSGVFFYSLKNITFDRAPWNPPNLELPDAKTVITNVLRSKSNVTALMISSLQDIGEFFDRKDKTADFMKYNFTKFISQGGYEVEATEQAAQSGKSSKPKVKVTLKPVKDMANNKFNLKQAANYTNHLAAHKLTSDTWSREAAKAARLPGTFMKEMFQYGPIGAHLEWLWMRQEFKFYWDPFNWPFMDFLNVDWYLNTRLGLDKTSADFNELRKTEMPFSDAAPRIKVIAYDGCAAVGAVGDDFMRAMGVLDPESKLPAYNRPDVAGHPHRVFGKKADDLGGINARRLAQVMKTFLLGGMIATAGRAESLIPRASIKHDHEESGINLDGFRARITLRNLRIKLDEDIKRAEEAKAAGKDKEYRRDLGTIDKRRSTIAVYEERIKREERVTRISEPVRASIPYEQLYQQAMGQTRK
ncbi:uncharacterized protein B0H64DRAFT_354421 [Chaetomium fimeti]|uniref:Inosine/uridine-preferring nucleoside hydrolase domain-containing protein n=1 Tax=Chaetomium fimeti TaxID=1854472 RepID=A0AAE0LV18_9PEZI|nr:hypothetical protein B0H64DRAFT_354421 [Chaetomium fimeti]